jgi:hypothetical protein
MNRDKEMEFVMPKQSLLSSVPGKLVWSLTSACAVAVLLQAAGCTPDKSPYQAEIKRDADYSAATPLFTGSGSSTPLAQIVAADHPYMAARGHNSMHSDASMSGTHPEAGPLGSSGEFDIGSANMAISLLGGGECGNTTFTSTGLLISFCADFDNFRVYALQALTDENGKARFRKVASYALPERESSIKAKQSLPVDIGLIMNDTSGGAYFRLDDQDRITIADATNTLQVLELSSSLNSEGFLTGSFNVVTEEALGLHVPNDVDYAQPGHEDITDVIADWNAPDVYWFVTRQGTLAAADLSGASPVVNSIKLPGEEIQNATAMDASGIYIVSDFAMYKYQLNASHEPVQVWRKSYDRGTAPKPGQLNQGSGTTPTLMGENNEYVAITDNADPVNILVYQRDNGELICQEPVFAFPLAPGDSSGMTYASATDNSLIGYRNSLVVENNWGYSNVLANNWTQPGLTRVDVQASVTPGDLSGNCTTVWENTTEASQSTVPKLSLGSGLVYIYTREDIPGNAADPQDAIGDQAYYFGALDFQTGEVVFKTLTGTGRNWNNNYAPITIGPDGTAYVGTYNGIISIQDK